jgi:drug/metabolite transporter (DMT)-like permease
MSESATDGRRRYATASLALVVAVVAVSWAAILVRLCEAPSLGIAFYRLLFSTLVMLPWGIRASGKASPRVYALAATAGVLLGLHFATWISSLEYTTVASSVVLVSTQPVFTAVLGPFFLRERPGPVGWVAVALALGGTAILAGGDWGAGGAAVVGDLLALAGALTASVYLMIGRRVRESIPFARYLLVVYGSAAATVAVLAVGRGDPLVGYPAATWGWIALLAIGPNLIGHGLLNWSVRRLRAFPVNLSILGEPVLATLYAAFLFREIPGAIFYGGAVLIAVGVVLAVREESTLARGATARPQ